MPNSMVIILAFKGLDWYVEVDIVERVICHF